MSIKEFLSIYDSNYTFLSFGKWMYATGQGVEVAEDSGFGLDTLPFTGGSHCRHNFSRGDSPLIGGTRTYSYCPGHQARSKVLVKPNHHKRVNIHGMGFDLRKPGLMHFDTSVAHLKEWRGLLVQKQPEVPIYHPPVDFNVSHINEVNIIDFWIAHQRVDGKVLMQDDSELKDWMHFVASGCSK